MNGQLIENLKMKKKKLESEYNRLSSLRNSTLEDIMFLLKTRKFYDDEFSQKVNEQIRILCILNDKVDLLKEFIPKPS